MFRRLVQSGNNASLHSVPEGGTITIRVHKSFHGKDRTIRGIRLTVADNGGGISRANRARVFEPFFTTKGERGTGLGLWVARGIIDGLRGTIALRSSVHPGESGTCFSIFLPNQIANS
jgi:two-component system, chemotaxis family, CheB/CheR fusion protein